MTDTPGYEPLIFVDPSSEDELVEAAVERMRVTIPEWVPDVAQTEMVLLESLAIMVGMEVFAANEMPQAMLEQLLQLYGVARSEGEAASAVVEIGVNESSPEHVVPVGTRLRFTLEDTGESFDLLTDEQVTFYTSQSLVERVPVTLEESGASVNGVSGLSLDVVDPLHFVEYARLVTPLVGGTDPEEDDALWQRGSTVLARQVGTLVLAEHFQYAAMTDPRVARALAMNLRDPERPSEEAVGHVSVGVLGAAGAVLSEEVMGEVQRSLVEKAMAGLHIHVGAPTLTPVDVVVRVIADGQAHVPTVQAAVDAALRDALSAATGTWSGSIHVGELTARVARVAGVAWVQELSVDSTVGSVVDGGSRVDLPDDGFGALPVPGEIVVEVQGNG